MSNLEEKRVIREAAARAAIKNSLDTHGAESETAEFVLHHLEELGTDYWMSCAGTAAPEPLQVVGLLELHGSWGPDGGDELENFDFTLPGGVTDYVLCVRFDNHGEVVELSMES